jgi:signal transduction histidine kinase
LPQHFRTKIASSAADALTVLSREPVAVLVMEARMLAGTGKALLQHVAQQRPAVVRVLLACPADVERCVRAVNEGLVARYAVKPWDADELERLLAWALQVNHLGGEHLPLLSRLLRSERLIALGHITAATVHDLNQPVAYLSDSAERLGQLGQSAPALAALVQSHGAHLEADDRRNLQELAAELAELGDDLRAGCAVLRKLIHDVRRLSRPAVDEPAGQPVDAMPAVRFGLAVCQEQAVRAGAVLRYEGPTDLPPVRFDATDLTVVLINLTSNGLQAVAAKQAPDGCVIVQAADLGASVQFSVRDDGVGMSEQVLRKVGAPLFSTRGQGVGLGVPQAQRLVERAGGTFRIESTEGQGTTVTFTVPKT